jgi:hypothetical protein
MTLDQLLPELQALARSEKLRLIQLLAADVAREEGMGFAEPDKEYPLWSPHNAFEGAATLLKALEEDKARS